MIAAAIFVGIFVGGALEDHAFDAVVGCHAEIENLLGRYAANRHLDVGCHPGWRFELVIDDEANFVIVADGVSFAEIDDRCTGHDL